LFTGDVLNILLPDVIYPYQTGRSWRENSLHPCEFAFYKTLTAPSFVHEL
jgi:hypothetical protein